MTGRVGIRQIIVLSAAVCLLLISSRAFAQAPPAGSDTDQRLKALEGKMDRVLKVLEARRNQPAGINTVGSLETMREKLRVELKAKEKEYADFRAASPLVVIKSGQGSVAMIAEALAKYEAKRSALKANMEDIRDQIARVEKAYDGGKGRPAALRIMLGIKAADAKSADAASQLEKSVAVLAAQRKVLVGAFGEKHDSVKDADNAIALVRKTFAASAEPAVDSEIKSYLAALREEMESLASKIETLTNVIDVEKKNSREHEFNRAQNEQYQADIGEMRQMLTAAEKQLASPTTSSTK